MFRDLRGFLAALDGSGELIHLDMELSPRFEIAAAIKHLAQHKGKAILCEKVAGYDIPVIGNLNTRKNIARALGVAEGEIEETCRERAQNLIKPEMAASGPVQEIVEEGDINILRSLPVLTHHERDAGPYLTSALVVAKDPETGVRGMGLHRIFVKDKETIGIFLGNPPLSHFLTKAENRDKPLEIAVVSGADLLTFLASIVHTPEEGIDKFDIAGGLARKPIELVRCRTVDLEAPAHAEFVLEGYIIPNRREKEGPFGESSGYYLTYDNPVAKIKAVTSRANPIYHALVPFSGEEGVLTSLMWQAFLVPEIQKALPQVRRMEIEVLGEFLIVQVEKKNEEDGKGVIDYLLRYPFVKIVVVVDEDVEISSWEEVKWALVTRAYFDKDIVIRHGMPGFQIDPATRGGKRDPRDSRLITETSKMGIDATKPLKQAKKFEMIDVPSETNKRVLKLIEKIG